MRIVNTYTYLQYPTTRFIINSQSYKIDTSDLLKGISATYFKLLLDLNSFKLINKPNA